MFLSIVHKLTPLILMLAPAALLISCGEEKPPSRDVFPVIKERLFTLQQAVENKQPAVIDSLMSRDALEKGMDADSLLRFVYGPDGSFPFKRFGEYDIVHTDRIAQVICYVMDSTADRSRPMRFLFQPRGDEDWVVRSFETWIPEADSLTDSIDAERVDSL